MWFTYWRACPRQPHQRCPPFTRFPPSPTSALAQSMPRCIIVLFTFQRKEATASIDVWRPQKYTEVYFPTTNALPLILIVLDNVLSLYPSQANQCDKATFDIWASLGLEEKVVILVRPDQSVPAHFNLAFYCKRYHCQDVTSTCLKTIFVSLGCSTLSQLFPVFLSMPDLRRPFTYITFCQKNVLQTKIDLENDKTQIWLDSSGGILALASTRDFL